MGGGEALFASHACESRKRSLSSDEQFYENRAGAVPALLWNEGSHTQMSSGQPTPPSRSGPQGEEGMQSPFPHEVARSIPNCHDQSYNVRFPQTQIRET